MRLTILAVITLTAIGLCSACGPSESPAPAAATPVAAPANPAPFGFLNTPAENQTVKPGTYVSGWALDESGIAEVSIVTDDGQKLYVHVGDDFPGVKEKYPSYPNADKAGYVFIIPKMTSGPHSLTVTVRAKDGGTQVIRRQFLIP